MLSWLIFGAVVVGVFLTVRLSVMYRRLKRENDAYRTNLEPLVASRLESLVNARTERLTRENDAYRTNLESLVASRLEPLVNARTEQLKRENDAYRTNLEVLVADRTQQWKIALSDLEKSYDIMLGALGDALDLKEGTTEFHSRRVTAYTIAIARKMGLPREEIDVIARGAFLHDIGKMAIPDDILLKPGKLTDEEMAKMREHCYFGYKIIKDIPFLAGAAEIIHAHHERYDGTGYPRALKGTEIPLGARFVAVANTLDVITFDQPYRPAQTFEAARKEIELWSGRQFDPEIVKVFLEMPDHIWEGMRNDINAARTSSPTV